MGKKTRGEVSDYCGSIISRELGSVSLFSVLEFCIIIAFL